MVPKAKDGHLDPNPLDVRTKLAKNARRFRKAAKLTQQDVAEQAQLELSTILRLEHAKFDSTLSTVSRVRKALGVSWEKLLRGI
jgi:transcriptional regulator with XRE-family HTH domain